MQRLVLVEPSMLNEKQVMEYRKSMLNSKDEGELCAGLAETENYADWLNFKERLQKKYGDDYVPSKVYLAIRKSDGKMIGLIDFRQFLNEKLLKIGGNIGYSVLQNERNNGYAKEMMKLLLKKVKGDGYKKVLMICRADNIASKKVILACGGVFEKQEIFEENNINTVFEKYWIEL